MRYSHSHLELYDKCPAAYDYKYNQRISEGPPSEQLDRGRKAHKELEMYLLNPVLELPKIAKDFDQEIPEMRAKHKATPEERWYYDKRWRPLPRDRRDEARFVMVTDAHWIRSHLGWVVDFKTGKIREKQHVVQARRYGAGMLLRFPKIDVANVEFYYLDYATIREEEVRRGDIKAIIRGIEEKIVEIEDDKTWKARPSRLCGWCPFSKTVDGPCKAG